jgi:Ricin-type beta-trefoil lectin domain-like
MRTNVGHRPSSADPFHRHPRNAACLALLLATAACGLSDSDDQGDQELNNQRIRRIQLLPTDSDGQFFAIASKSNRVLEPTTNNNVHGGVEAKTSPLAQQYWQIDNINDNKYYRIRNASTGQCLDASSSSLTVSLAACSSALAQQWTIAEDVGYGQILLNSTKQCLTLGAGSAVLKREPCSKAPAQLFQLLGGAPTPVSSAPGPAQFVAYASGRFIAPTKTSIGQAQDPQPPVALASSDNYSFTLAGDKYYLGPQVGEGRYAFIKAAGMTNETKLRCLQADANSTTTTLAPCNLALHTQQFLRLQVTMTAEPHPSFASNSSGYITIRSPVNSRILEVPGGGITQGQRLDQWHDITPRAAWGQWYLDPANDGSFYIKNANSHLCMDAEGFGTESDSHIQQWSCSGAANQKWRFFKTSGGGQNIEWAIRNEHSKLFLSYAEAKDGAAAIQQPVNSVRYGLLRFLVEQSPHTEVVRVTPDSATNVPVGLYPICARDADTLESSSTCLVAHHGGTVIWPYSYADNRLSLGLTFYDRNGNTSGGWVELFGPRRMRS